MTANNKASHRFYIIYETILFFYSDKNVRQDCRKTTCSDTRRENVLKRFRQLRKYLRNKFHAQSEREAQRHYQRSLSVNLLRSDDTYSGSGYGTEHQQSGTSKYRFRHKREHKPYSREQTEQD